MPQTTDQQEPYRAARREYMRDYRRLHGDRIREQTRIRSSRRRDVIRENSRRYRERHRNEERERVRRWSQEHLFEKRRYMAEYREQNKGQWEDFARYLDGLIQGYDSKKAAATYLGISQSSLQYYLSGNRKPGRRFLLNMSEKFNLPYETLNALVQK